VLGDEKVAPDSRRRAPARCGTWLPGPVLGMFFYLYLIVDIYSRKIVGWEVHERESAELAAGLLERAVWAERCLARPVVLHADNGSAMKGATMKATMERLGVIASFSRPRVSNDNPYSKGPVPNLQVWADMAGERVRLDRGRTSLGEKLRSLVQYQTSPQRHPLRHTRAASPPRRSGPACRTAHGLPGSP